MSKKKIFLFTSDIASFIGKNEYDFVTPFERLWKRCDSDDYNNIINKSKTLLSDKDTQIKKLENDKRSLNTDLESGKITKRQYTLRFNKLEKNINELKDNKESLEQKIDAIDLNQEERLKKTLGEDAIKLVQSKNIETQDKRDTMKKKIDEMNISQKQKDNLLKETTGFINKAHGTIKEESAIEIYEKRFGVKLDTSQTFFKKRLDFVRNTNFEWFFGGRIDGLYINESDPSKNYIVEVKNRTRGFFTSLRDYEKIQIYIYMYMLNISVAKLVEKYNDQIRITMIYKDEQYLNDILYYIDMFTERFECDFLRNIDLKCNFINSDNNGKKIILRKLYLNDINKEINKRLESELQDDLDDEECLINDDL
jgi:hypothetical protein